MIARVLYLSACMLCLMLSFGVLSIARQWCVRSVRDEVGRANLLLLFLGLVYLACVLCWRAFA